MADIVNLIGYRVPVLDKGFVMLADQMPHPSSGESADMAAVAAARTSFKGESKGEEADKKLLMYMLRNNHTSPFEQIKFKFIVYAPVVTWWQWTRHRTFQFQNANAQSGRYLEFDDADMHIPIAWREQSKSNKQGSSGDVPELENYMLTSKLVELQKSSMALYKEAVQMGVAKEQARLFLPGFCLYYRWMISVDAHNLMNFLRLRMADEAQYEIRVYAKAIYEEFFRKIMPWASEGFEQYVLKVE